MRRTALPLFAMLLLTMLLLSLLAGGCGSLRQYPSLGTYYVDDASLEMLDVERPDTVATLEFGDTVEVIDAPMEVRTSVDHFIVHRSGRFGRVERDFVMSELLFLSKYSHGYPVHVGPDGERFYRDEFGDTIAFTWREDAVQVANDKRDTVVTEKPKKKKKKSRRR